MSLVDRICQHFEDSAELKRAAAAQLAGPIAQAVEMLTAALAADRKLLVCGNGGSAADSQHMAAELVGRFERERPELAAIALSTDTSALTAVANDYGFEQVFARQVRALGREGDALVLISTSGHSANLLRAAEAARAVGVVPIGLLGRDGGPLLALCADAVVVPGRATARIQEAHIFIGHCWCAQIEHSLGLAGAA